MQIFVIAVGIVRCEYFAELLFYIKTQLLLPKLARHVIDIDLIYGFNSLFISPSSPFWLASGK
jgi:hypothetical protein